MTTEAQTEQEPRRSRWTPPPPNPDDPETWIIPPLEDVQRNAATAPEGPVIVLGGAGTGKSQVLDARSLMLVSGGADPSHVTTITFNARASHRTKGKIGKCIGKDPAEAGFFIGTLHGYCSMFLRQAGWQECGIDPGFSISDQEQSVTMLEQIVTEEPDKPCPMMPSELEKLLNWIANNDCLGQQEQIPAPEASWHDFAEQYRAEKRAQNVLDFTDLLTMTRRALQASSRLRSMYAETRTRHLIIDEFQDFTPINYELLLLMRGPTHSVTIAVDPNQSIYSWRGASPELVERFRYDFAGAQECGLSMNHRTASSVMRTWREMATNPDMSGLVDDYQRALRPAKQRPAEVAVEGLDEVEYTAIANHINRLMQEDKYKPEDFAILVRQRRRLKTIGKIMDGRGLAYHVLGEESREGDPDGESIRAMLTLAINPNNAWALRRAGDVSMTGKLRALNHRIARNIQKTAHDRGCDLIEATALVSEQLVPDSGVRQGLEYTLQTYAEMQRMMLSAVPTREMITEIYHRLYEAGSGRRKLQMNPEMLRISTMADRNDRALPASATGRQRVVTLLESFSNAAHPDEQSEDNQDPFRHQQGVTLGTIHSSKGLQWPVVFIADMADHIIPGKSADNNLARMEEEQRLMYVAVTRAEDQYYLYWATTTEDGGDAEPSRFIDVLMK